MKIWAKVRFKNEESAEKLILAFFSDFNPKSSFSINGQAAELEIFFDSTPPKRVIEHVAEYCNVDEFVFSGTEDKKEEETSEEVEPETEEEAPSEETEPETEEEETSEETEPETEEEEPSEETESETEEEETSEETEPETVEEKTSQQAEQPKKKKGRPRTRNVESVNSRKTSEEIVNIPELAEIAKKATSFEHFVKLVAEWLEMDQRKEFFEKLACVAAKVETVSWKEVEKALNNKGVLCTSWDRIWISKQVSEKLKGYSVTLMPLLNAIRQYKDYSFGNEQPEEEFSTEQETEEELSAEQGPEEESSTEQETEETAGAEEEAHAETEETTTKSKVKMECMPEIPQFEEALRSVDKLRTIEYRVMNVLSAMGVHKKNSVEKNEIFEIANTAMRMRRMDIARILLMADIPVENSTHARMTFSQFINDFVSENGSDKRVNLLDFLQQLQKIVMDESEIQSLPD